MCAYPEDVRRVAESFDKTYLARLVRAAKAEATIDAAAAELRHDRFRDAVMREARRAGYTVRREFSFGLMPRRRMRCCSVGQRRSQSRTPARVCPTISSTT